MASRIGYDGQVKEIVSHSIASGQQTAVKFHPRDKERDALGLDHLCGVKLLPAAIPFEAMLPMLQEGVEILGDFSTTLITARLLRPDAHVKAIVHEDAKARAEFESLYQRIGIHCINRS